MSSTATAQKIDRRLTLRSYQPRDIARMTQIIMHAIPRMPNYKMITPDADRIRFVLENNIANGVSFASWVVIDSDDIVQGGIGAWCVKNILSHDLVADDVFLWIEPDYRSIHACNLLIQTYIDWAVARGAKLVRASHTGGSWPKGSREYKLFDALLQRNGFQEVGSIYHLNMYGD
jgi:hypothetical protein